jgi:hypothetical protein
MSFNYQAIKDALKEAGHLVSEGEAWVASDFSALYQFAKDKFGLLHDKVAYGLAFPSELPTDFPGHPNAGEEVVAVDTSKQIQPVVVPAASTGVTSVVDTTDASVHAAILEARVAAGVPTGPAPEAEAEEAAPVADEAPVAEEAAEPVVEQPAPEVKQEAAPAPEVKEEVKQEAAPEVKQEAAPAPAPGVKQEAAPTPPPEVKQEAEQEQAPSDDKAAE